MGEGGKAYVSDPAAHKVDVYYPLVTRLPKSSFGTFSGESPRQLTVDQSNGDVYVIDYSNNSLDRFDASGNPKNFTAGPGAGSNEITGLPLGGFGSPDLNEVAVDSSGGPADGDIYVTDGEGKVRVFANSGEPLATLVGSPLGAFELACGVAVDQANGDLYVSDLFTGRISRFSPSGSTVNETTDYSGAIATTVEPCSVAVGDGKLYTGNTNNSGPIYRYDTSAFATGTPPSPSSTVLDSSLSTEVSVDPSNGDVYVDEGTRIHVYNSTGTSLYTFGEGDFGTGGFSSHSHGVAVMGEGGKAYVSDPAAHKVDVYTPSVGGSIVLPPSVTTLAATGVGLASATLNATVNPNANLVTDCHFEYVDDAEFQAEGFGSAQSTPCSPAPGGGGEAVPVSAEPTGLTPATTYHSRIVATTSVGTRAGGDATFTTKPLANTDTASAIDHTEATLNGHFDPQGNPALEVTDCYFEWGTDTSYSGGTVPCAEGTSFSSAESVSALLNNITPGATYHYRLHVGTGGAGEFSGSDVSVETPPFSVLATEVTSIDNVASKTLAFDQAHKKLYDFSLGSQNTGAIRGFDASAPPNYPPLTGFAPRETAVGSDCSSLAIDASSGNVYLARYQFGGGDPHVGTIQGFAPDGSPLGGAFPIDPRSNPGGFGGELCGAAVDSSGDIWVNAFKGSIDDLLRYSPSGVFQGSIDIGALGIPTANSEEVTQLAFDSNDDLYLAGGGGIWRLSAASSYTEATRITPRAPGNTRSYHFAIDTSTHDIFLQVEDVHGARIREFDSNGNLLATFAKGISSLLQGVAVDPSNHYIYVGDPANQKIRVFHLEGSRKPPTLTPGSPSAVSGNSATLNAKVDPETFQVTDCHFELIPASQFAASEYKNVGAAEEHPCTPPPGSGSGDVAVSANVSLEAGNTYHFRIVVSNANPDGTETGPDQTFSTTGPSVSGESADNITDTAATLHASVNPNGVTTGYHFEYVTDAQFQASGFAGAESVPATDASAGSAGSAVAVAQRPTGLQPGTTYHFRVVATDSSGIDHGAGSTFATYPSGPLAEGESIDQITETSATLHAKVNPFENATGYHFEYVTDAQFQASGFASATNVPASDESLGSGSSTISVAQPVEGLQPGTAYHFRVVATNANGTNHGPGKVFTAYTALPSYGSCPNEGFRDGPSAKLPDCRAYEQASPADKHGLGVLTNRQDGDTAADGNAVAFSAVAGLPAAGGASQAYAFIALRTSSGWRTTSSTPILPAGHEVVLNGYTPNLTTSYSSDTDDGNFYIGDLGAGTWDKVLSPAGGISFDTSVGAVSGDPQRFLLSSRSAFTPDAVDFTNSASQINLYDYDRGTLSLADRVPVFPATSCDDDGGPDCISSPEGAENRLGLLPGLVSDTMSDDGSRILFTESGSGRIYLREGSKTVQVNASQASSSDPNGHKPAHWWASSPDGATAYFTSCEKLTDDATAVSTNAGTCGNGNQRGGNEVGADLYAYEAGTGQLHDLTVDSNSDPKGADVKTVLAVSPDGSWIYFLANGRLAPGAQPGDCTSQEGQCELYAIHDGGAPVDVTTYSAADSPTEIADNYAPKAWAANNGTLLLRTTRPLTSYDNTGLCKRSGKPDETYVPGPCTELYRYQPGEGSIICVSCDPTGAPPIGRVITTSQDVADFLGVPPSSHRADASFTRNLSADGNRVFFQTPEKLVIADTNGDGGCPENFNPAHQHNGKYPCQDVYEWEAPGSGSCTQGGPAYSAQDAGCLYLLSSGTNDNDSGIPYLIGASVSGNDVFIRTTNQLVPQDEDELYDIYDIRVQGGLASQHEVNAPPCGGPEQCRAAGTQAPAAAGAGSAAFSGPGNQPVQRKAHKKHHRKKRHHRHVQHRKASSNRGGSK
jgi:phosphodiesterase/alkaline phosphatase D-like protein